MTDRSRAQVMLQRIRINGYCSCMGVELEGMGPITALVGRNGSGKTNILKGIARLARMVSSSDLSLLPPPSPGNAESESYLAEVFLAGNLYRYTVVVHRANKSQGTVTGPDGRLQLGESLALVQGTGESDLLFTREEQRLTIRGISDPPALTIGPLVPALTAVSVYLPEEAELLRHARPLLQFFQRTAYCAFEEPSEVRGGIVVSDKELQAWGTGQPFADSDTPDIVMRLMHAYYNERDKFNELCGLLGPSGLELIKAINVVSFQVPIEGQPYRPRYHSINFEPGGLLGGGENTLYFSQLSLGTRRVIRILAALILDDFSVLLVEHPEEAIHPGLLKKLAGLLRDNADPTQIILSSHSPEVFNSLRSEDIRLVLIRDGTTSVRSLTPPQVKAATEYIREAGTLAEFLAMTQEV
jgi:hypothetical protein